MRVFTLEEANAAVAELRPVVERMVQHRRNLTAAQVEQAELVTTQDLRQAAVGRLHGEYGAEEILDALPGVVALPGLGRESDDGVNVLGEQGSCQRLPVREPAVDRAHPDVGGRGDLLERHPDATLGHQLTRCVEDPAAVAFGVATQRAG